MYIFCLLPFCLLLMVLWKLLNIDIHISWCYLHVHATMCYYTAISFTLYIGLVPDIFHYVSIVAYIRMIYLFCIYTISLVSLLVCLTLMCFVILWCLCVCSCWILFVCPVNTDRYLWVSTWLLVMGGVLVTFYGNMQHEVNKKRSLVQRKTRPT